MQEERETQKQRAVEREKEKRTGKEWKPKQEKRKERDTRLQRTLRAWYFEDKCRRFKTHSCEQQMQEPEQVTATVTWICPPNCSYWPCPTTVDTLVKKTLDAKKVQLSQNLHLS